MDFLDERTDDLITFCDGSRANTYELLKVAVAPVFFKSDLLLFLLGMRCFVFCGGYNYFFYPMRFLLLIFSACMEASCSLVVMLMLMGRDSSSSCC